MIHTQNAQTWRILHIDDDEEDHFIVRYMLGEAKGRTVTLDWAASFEEGRQKLMANNYQAVLVDYDLGVATGIDLIREFVERGYAAPMILLTGRGSGEVDMEAMRAGATVYLTKNEINPMLLERSIRYAIERKQTEARLRESEAKLLAREEELRFSEAKFSIIFERSPTPTLLFSWPDARFVDVNEAYLNLIGFEKAEVIGKTSLELGILRSEETRNRIAELLEHSGYAGGIEMVTYTKTGEERITVSNLARIEINGQFFILGTAMDITEHTQAHVLLQRSLAQADEGKRMLEALMEYVPEGITIADAPDVNIRMVSRYGQEILGGAHAQKTAEQVAEEWKVYNPDGLTPLETDQLPLVRAVKYGEVVKNQDLVQVNSRGQHLSLSCNAGPIRDASGAIIGGVVVWRDISERKQVESELRSREARLHQSREDLLERNEALFESERKHRELADALEVERAKLAAAIDHLPIGVGIGDTQGNTLSLNAAGLKLHGFHSESEMFSRLDHYIDEFELRYLDGRVMPVADWPVSRALRGEFVHDYELRLHNKLEGTEHILSYSVAPVQNSAGETVLIVYVMQDMTERKRVENTLRASETQLRESSEALRENEARFRQMAEAMPQLVWTAQPDGTVDYYNQRYRLYAGIGETAAGGWEWSPVLHPADLQATMDAWQGALRTGRMYQIEHRVHMADGSVRWHLSRGVPVFDEQGRVVKWYGTATDIHDLKQAQADLAAYAEKLKQSNQELESFAFVASHDLQEPLRKIRLFGEGLRTQLGQDLPPEADDYLARMQNAAERMQAMINGLLDLSRVNTRGGEFEQVDLNQVAHEVVSDLEARLQSSGGQVIIGALPTVKADALQMRQLLQNLVGNALKFHENGVAPVVRISGEVVQLEHAPWARIVIQDNGIGFDATNTDQIFQPFVRLHGRSSQYEGSGMGLAICRKIVERHGGSITASSQPGGGSRFTITIPI